MGAEEEEEQDPGGLVPTSRMGQAVVSRCQDRALSISSCARLGAGVGRQGIPGTAGYAGHASSAAVGVGTLGDSMSGWLWMGSEDCEGTGAADGGEEVGMGEESG